MEWIQTIISTVLISGILFYINKKSTEGVEKNIEGKYELRMNVVCKWIGLLCLIISAGTIVGSVLFYEEGVLTWVAMILLIFGGLGIVLMMYYNNHRLTFDDQSIMFKSWTGEVTNVKWYEIKEINFSSVWGYLKLRTSSQDLKISHQLVGLIQFVVMMEAQTSFKAKELKLPFKLD